MCLSTGTRTRGRLPDGTNKSKPETASTSSNTNTNSNTAVPLPDDSSTLRTTRTRTSTLVWPVHPLFILAIVPFLPSYLYLNRGYTVWYNLTALVYLLTRIEPLRRFIIVQGTGISIGWYAALTNDLYRHGRFAHILYMNMPSFMKEAMVDSNGHVFYTNNSIIYMSISHILDTLFHPGIVYFLYKAHCRSCETHSRNGHAHAHGHRVKEIFSWNIIIATFAVARLWSLVHTYYHTGLALPYYFGYDVYHIHDLDSWMPAYVAEGIFYATLITYKLSSR